MIYARRHVTHDVVTLEVAEALGARRYEDEKRDGQHRRDVRADSLAARDAAAESAVDDRGHGEQQERDGDRPVAWLVLSGVW